MYNVANISDNDKRILFRNTAQQMGVHESIVEKDFWVCLTLDYLFHLNCYRNLFIFKGGTSLSKAYGLIHRFSEDIDLILDWQVLGYGRNEPWNPRSKTQQDRFNKEANDKGAEFLKTALLPLLNENFSAMLKNRVEFRIDEDPLVIKFNYPLVFEESPVMQSIRLEIGVLAAWSPSNLKVITPYVADNYRKIFQKPNTQIKTAAAERTLWEKLTILHQEANRPQNKPMPPRYSRHYYDLYCIANSSYKEKAFKNLDLLDDVVKFKQKFYPRSWARYENAKPGSIMLVPPRYNLGVLRNDYESMKSMLYGDYPTFDELMDFIGLLENEINQI